ncbi:MAG: CBS domain-containing protein [Beijerinckiaceae bacterium]|jgi:CBS domain-containing protein|nr:CBS domain-containing protein [Beijerinckiaceae bacterium]
MSVGRLLNGKGHAVITAHEDQTLHEASRLLAEYRIGAVIIGGEGGTVAGILSERDIVRAMAQHGAAALEHPVSQHMTRKVITCTAAMELNEVMEIMTAGKFRHVPVLKDGRLDGMISIGDVVKYRLAQLENESRSLRDYIAAS